MNDFKPAKCVIEADYLRTPGKHYTFYSDFDLAVGDYVVVDSMNGPGIAKVVAVMPYADPTQFNYNPRFVVCPLPDFREAMLEAHSRHLQSGDCRVRSKQ